MKGVKIKGSSKLVEFLSTTKQGQSYVILIATLVLILIVLFIGFIPSLNAIFAQYSENQAKREVLGILEKKSTVLNQLKFDYQQKATTIERFNSSLPEEYKEETIIAAMNKLVEDNNLFLGSLSFNEVELNKDIATTYSVSPKVSGKYVAVRMEGTRENIVTFLSQIEQSRYIFNVQNLSYTKNDRNNTFDIEQGREYILNMQIEVYYWNLKK